MIVQPNKPHEVEVFHIYFKGAQKRKERTYLQVSNQNAATSAQDLFQKGFYFTIEQLLDGRIAILCMHGDTEQARSESVNGPQVIVGFTKLIEDMYKKANPGAFTL